jgi:hypothetical protein
MSLILRLLLPLIGYACVATVISMALGYGYLRKSGHLDDDKVFRIVAMIQGVDLDELAKAKSEDKHTTPAEEPSFDDQQRQLQTMSLHFDAKQKQLGVSLVNFDFQLKQLNALMSQYATLRDEVENYLREQGQLVLSDQMQKVRAQLESLHPSKQAKPMLIKYITDNRIDEVIMLLGSMKLQKQEAILKTFNSDEEQEMLYRIQRKMLAGDPAKPFIDAKLQALEQLKAQEK